MLFIDGKYRGHITGFEDWDTEFAVVLSTTGWITPSWAKRQGSTLQLVCPD